MTDQAGRLLEDKNNLQKRQVDALQAQAFTPAWTRPFTRNKPSRFRRK